MIEMRKTYESCQHFFLVCCIVKFIIFKSLCLSSKYLGFHYGRFTFRKHYKIAIGIKGM